MPAHSALHQSTIKSVALAQPLFSTASKNKPEKKNAAVIRILDMPVWLAPVIALHKQVRGEIPANEPPVLMPKSESYFLDLLNKQTGLLLGCFIGHELAGITALLGCTTFASAQQNGLLTCPDTSLSEQFDQGPIAVIQSVCVQKKFGQNGLCKALIGQSAMIAQDKGFTDIFAQAAAHNAPSIGVFKKLCFEEASTWTNGHARVLLHRPLLSL